MKRHDGKPPDKIRRETVPVKHSGLIYGFLGGVLGVAVWFGGWGLLHQEQVLRYPEYVSCAVKTNLHRMPLFRTPQLRGAGMDAAQLRYVLLRYGNADHRLDAAIIRRGWYPKTASPVPWVRENGAVAPVYSDSPVMVFKWPVTLSLFTFLGALIWGLVSDYRYRAQIIAGIPFDGSVVATVGEYNRQVKGDGMAYRVRPWKDR
jgi:hypothetical protein